jgi:hypothetical protein
LVFQENSQPINRDTTFVLDTCGIKLKMSTCDSTFYLNWRQNEFVTSRMLAQNMFRLDFDFPAIKLPKYPKDTNIYVSWRDIDTIYFSVREAFNKIENDYGFFRFWKAAPQLDTGRGSQLFWIEFDNWVLIPYVEYAINSNIQNANCEFYGGPDYESTIVLDDQSDFPFYLNTDNTNLHISSNAEPIINYAIYNLQGNAISQSNNINYQNALYIDISPLSNGIYFLRINTQISKFIINR